MRIDEVLTSMGVDHLSKFKRKDIPGLYNYKHYEGPDGTYIQIRDGAGSDFNAVFVTPEFETQYDSFDELRDAVFEYFEET